MVMASLDGFYEGPGEGWEKIDWHRADDEWETYSIELLKGTGTLLFGRKTYEGFAEYWPTQQGELARLLNEIPKVVFSRTLERADWKPARLVKDRVPEEVAALKQQPGKDVLILGSVHFASTLMRSGLIDEYRIAINPVALRGGTPLFQAGPDRLNLKLVGTKIFKSGIVMGCYAPDMG
jgi:dihydrofolate reductase